MTDKSKTVPDLRFSGFTDAWEQRKFDEITIPAGVRNKDDLPLEPYSITNDRGFLPQNEAHDAFGYMQNPDRKAYNGTAYQRDNRIGRNDGNQIRPDADKGAYKIVSEQVYFFPVYPIDGAGYPECDGKKHWPQQISGGL